MRSSSPAPRSPERHRAPATAPATHGAANGSTTSATCPRAAPRSRQRAAAPRRPRADTGSAPTGSCGGAAATRPRSRRCRSAIVTAEDGNDRLRGEHHAAAPVPSRCQPVAARRHASAASRWIVASSSTRSVPRSTLRPDLLTVHEDALGDLLIAAHVDHRAAAPPRRSSPACSSSTAASRAEDFAASSTSTGSSCPSASRTDEVRAVPAACAARPRSRQRSSPRHSVLHQQSRAGRPSRGRGRSATPPSTRTPPSAATSPAPGACVPQPPSTPRDLHAGLGGIHQRPLATRPRTPLDRPLRPQPPMACEYTAASPPSHRDPPRSQRRRPDPRQPPQPSLRRRPWPYPRHPNTSLPLNTSTNPSLPVPCMTRLMRRPPPPAPKQRRPRARLPAPTPQIFYVGGG